MNMKEKKLVVTFAINIVCLTKNKNILQFQIFNYVMEINNLIVFLPRWYAKRFLHPDIVAPYDYIFIWDEDLGVEHFNAEE
jgi:hypothetical protein